MNPPPRGIFLSSPGGGAGPGGAGQILGKLGQFRNSGRTLVLLTGDGNDNAGRMSFVDAVDRALQEGWAVEVWAWRGSTSRRYIDFAREYTSRSAQTKVRKWLQRAVGTAPRSAAKGLGFEPGLSPTLVACPLHTGLAHGCNI